MDGSAEIAHGDDNDGNRDENPQAKRWGQAEHQNHRQHHRDDRLRGVHDSRAQNHAHRVQVIGGARHELAGAIAHIKFGLHKQEPIEQVVAKIEFDIAGEAD